MTARLNKVHERNVADKIDRKPPSEADLRALVERAAYYRAEKRGFAPGAEIDDWIAAEADVMARLRAGRGLI